jgi:O-antigen ligase
MTAVELLRRAHVGRAVPVSWAFLFLVAAAIFLAAITSAEQVTFSVAGADLNLRVAAYFGVAAVTGLLSLPILVAMDRRPIWLKLMLATVAWFAFTALVARQSPVEWLPTVVRFALYFGAATICYWFGRSLTDPGQVRRVSRLLPLAILAAAAIPAVAGIAEFIRGSAPIVNGAPRVSGSMPTHPVAYSLVLALSALAIMGPAFLLGRKRGAILRWIAVAVLTALVFTTFTRLSILLLVASGAAVAALLPATRRLRLMRVGGALVVGASVVLLAQPTFEARFTYPTPLSEVIAGATQNPTPGGGDPGADDGGDIGGEIEVDNSIAYRIMLTKYGLEYLAQSPIVGHGPGSFHRLFEAESGRARVAAHNDFMSVAVETGLPGLGLYVLTLGAIVWALWRRRSTGILEADALVVTALVALLVVNIGAAIHNPTYFVEIQLPIWILVGTALGIGDRARSLAGDPARAIAEP